MKKKLKKHHFTRFWDMITSLYHMDVLVYAGNASYFIVLSIFPTVMLLLNLLSYTTVSGGVILDLLERIIPSPIMPSVERLLNSMYQSSSGMTMSVTALAALWAASRGVYGILVGLNRIYCVTENRGYVVTRFLSIVYTFLFLMVLVVTLAVHVFGQMILERIPTIDNPLVQLLWKIVSNRTIVLLVLQSFVFSAMFMFLPNRPNKLLPSLPGAVLASFGWQAFSNLYSLYVENSASFPTIYGSLTSICVGMLWLYTCVAILFYGGALNKYLMDIGYEIMAWRKRRKEGMDEQDTDYFSET